MQSVCNLVIQSHNQLSTSTYPPVVAHILDSVFYFRHFNLQPDFHVPGPISAPHISSILLFLHLIPPIPRVFVPLPEMYGRKILVILLMPTLICFSAATTTNVETIMAISHDVYF